MRINAGKGANNASNNRNKEWLQEKNLLFREFCKINGLKDGDYEVRVGDGNIAVYERKQIKNIEETKNLIILTIDWLGNGQTETVVYNKENITYIQYA